MQTTYSTLDDLLPTAWNVSLFFFFVGFFWLTCLLDARWLSCALRNMRSQFLWCYYSHLDFNEQRLSLLSSSWQNSTSPHLQYSHRHKTKQRPTWLNLFSIFIPKEETKNSQNKTIKIFAHVSLRSSNRLGIQQENSSTSIPTSFLHLILFVCTSLLQYSTCPALPCTLPCSQNTKRHCCKPSNTPPQPPSEVWSLFKQEAYTYRIQKHNSRYELFPALLSLIVLWICCVVRW